MLGQPPDWRGLAATPTYGTTAAGLAGSFSADSLLLLIVICFHQETDGLVLQSLAGLLDFTAHGSRAQDVPDHQSHQENARNVDDVLGGHLEPSGATERSGSAPLTGCLVRERSSSASLASRRDCRRQEMRRK